MRKMILTSIMTIFLCIGLKFSQVFAQGVIQATWTTQAKANRGKNGQQFTFYFPPGGTISSGVWGTDLYTDDCSIASAAVHAGLISTQNGGTVTIEIRAGAPAYKGSSRNGVKSNNWGAYRGSFVFVNKGTTIINQDQPPANAISAIWTTQAKANRGKNGQQFTFYFPPGGTISSAIWGTDLYTDDCSIASAAVHAGLISSQNGGTVTIEIRAGASAYKGSYRNGVTSKNYGAYRGSFVFVNKGTTIINQDQPSANAISAIWTTQAKANRGKNGQQFTFYFPPGGTISSAIWGTDLYTDDCSIASAAVHAGLISTQNGGTVTIEIRAGAPAYKGSYRNGVTSKNYGAYGGSFVFVNKGTTIINQDQPPANAISANWTTQAKANRGKNGQQFTFYFPPGGTISSGVWGTDLYTDDCSIASAAVHAGLISTQNGGTVTIEIRAGAPAYKGSSRNGVTSNNWGAYRGSFVFVK